MKVYSQLISAQLENKSSDYSATVIGRIWYNTADGKVKSTDGTLVRSFLKNDQKCIFGNSGTASQNTRFNRSAANALQLVTGDDTTAEGSTSTSCAMIDARAVNYTTAGLPAAAAGNKGRIVFDTTTSTPAFDAGGTWTYFASGATTTRVNAMYDYYVSATAGVGTHTTIGDAITAASDGQSIYILEGTYTETVSISKRLFITGSGFGSIIDGTVTFTSASDNSQLKNVKVTGDITLNAGADGVIVKDIALLNTKTFLVDSTVVSEILEATQY